MKKLGFGCLRLPMTNELGGEVDQKLFNQMVDRFMEAGFNYFDTAHPYLNGKSETAIREGAGKAPPQVEFCADQQAHS